MTNEDVLVRVDAGKPFLTGNADPLEHEFRQFQAISDRANRLLSRGDDFAVAFRKSVLALESDDLVSFANSKNGGTILIGVSRIKHGNGRQRVSVLGCPVGDRERLKILAKSNQCVPPVPVRIFVENCAAKPFYRIEIPSGPHKPYCTSGGTYKIRGDGRNEMLYPAQLLALLMESESGELVRWFQHATINLETTVQGTKPRITAERNHLNQPAWDMQSSIQDSLEEAAEAVSKADGDAGDAAAFSKGAGDCSVRLSSQDLCGFLMRLP
jgi:ATP-dependent DNA helicase RecG